QIHHDIEAGIRFMVSYMGGDQQAADTLVGHFFAEGTPPEPDDQTRALLERLEQLYASYTEHHGTVDGEQVGHFLVSRIVGNEKMKMPPTSLHDAVDFLNSHGHHMSTEQGLHEVGKILRNFI